jgi:hypothetical protein
MTKFAIIHRRDWRIIRAAVRKAGYSMVSLQTMERRGYLRRLGRGQYQTQILEKR